MRVNKYRVFHGGAWHYQHIGQIQNVDDTRFFNEQCVSGKTFYQFTGLLDKNGQEIYEGDIIVSGAGDRSFKISAHKSSYCLYVAKGNHVGWLDEQCLDEIKVIGNIHENPELLESDNG